MVARLGNGDDVKGFSYLAIAISVVFVICTVLTVLNVKERVVTKNQEKTSVKGMLYVLTKNDQVKVILGIALLFNIAYQLSNSFALYYFKYVIGDTKNILYPVYAGVAGIAQMASMAILPMFSAKVGKKAAFFMASVLPAAGLALLWAMGYTMPMNLGMVGVCSCIVNAGIGFMLVFITVILSEVVDYGEYKLGTRNESILFSMQTFVVKFGGAFSGFLSGVGLTVIGFVANQEQSAGTMTGMRVIMILLPAIMSVCCYLIYAKGYKLDTVTYRKIRDELRNRKENA